MRALIIYCGEKTIRGIAQEIARGLSGVGCKVDILEADLRGSDPISTAPYDIVCVGGPVVGRFGGQIPKELEVTLKRCTRTEGRQAAAFVRPGLFGTGKALRNLMGLLEAQGMQVRDFASLTNAASARNFGQRLHWKS